MRKALKWVGIFIGLVVVVIVGGFASLALIGRSRLARTYEISTVLPTQLVASASAERGERIAITRGCTDCHAEGMRGKVFLDVPPGIFIAPNLTKGRGGIGALYASADDWDHAIRRGIRPDGTPLLRQMPSWFFNRLSDVDVADLAAYLASMPPADNELPAAKLWFLGYAELGLPESDPAKRWELTALTSDRPAPGPTAEYGRYIASTACVGCHGQEMHGGPNHDPAGKPAPGLSHVGTWATEDFIRTLRTGVAPRDRQLTPWMPWVKFARFTDEELTALHEYVKTVRPPVGD